MADRGNSRIQVFDSNGTHLDTWPNLRFPNHIVATPDRNVWVSDGTNARLLKYDANGKLLYFWGTYGTYPGAFWELHQFSVDAEGQSLHRRQFRRPHTEVPPHARTPTARGSCRQAAALPAPTR